MNAPAQLDFGFPRPLGPKALASIPQKKPRQIPKRWSDPTPFAPREREIYSRFLSWQDQYAWEVGIPREGPI